MLMKTASTATPPAVKTKGPNISNPGSCSMQPPKIKEGGMLAPISHPFLSSFAIRGG